MPEIRDTFNSYPADQDLPAPWAREGVVRVLSETPTNNIIEARASSFQGINTSAYPSAYRSDISVTEDQLAELVFKGYNRGDVAFSATLRSGPSVRMSFYQAQTGVVPLGYAAWIVLAFAAGSSTPTISLQLMARYLSGSQVVEVVLAQQTLSSLASNSVVAVEAERNVISAYLNGTRLLSATDNNIASAGYIGLYSLHNWGGLTNTVGVRWDNWRGVWAPPSLQVGQPLSMIPQTVRMNVYRDPP